MRRLLPRAKPWQLVALAVIASGAAAALVAAESRAACADKAAARRLRWLALALLSVSTALSLLPLRWGWIALILLALHLAQGLLLRRAAWPSGSPPAPDAVPVERRRRREGDFFQIAWGAACGGLATACAGAGLGVAYVLVLDRFVSTWLPSLSDRSSLLAGLVGLFAQFFLCGAAAGGVLGARRPRAGAREMAAGLAGTVLAFYALHAAGTFLIEVPAFQQLRLLEEAGPALLAARLALFVVRLSAATLAGLAAAALAGPPEAPRPQPRVALAALAALLLTPWAVGLYAGRLSYDAILAGILLERAGRPEGARRLYTLGLAQHPDDKASAYLQFRIAMVHHRLKRDEDAKAVLRQLVARQAGAERLVELSEHYLRAWERAPAGARRVILPGVEMSTEFKAGYCVPNSLGLVMRFWGEPDTAKDIGRRITSMDWGTQVPDSVWYSEERGLRHFLLPLSTVDDVKSLIDEGLPALIYIPQHVLAVIGYDEALDSLVTYDVAEEEIWVDHPVSKLLPEWKGEDAVISLVLPEERFLRLPEERRRRLEAATVAHLHYLLHYPYHHADGARSRELALRHLEASAAADATKFYVLAHIFGRDQWGERARSALARSVPLRPLWLSGFAFARRDFGEGEALEELALSALDQGLRGEVLAFLYARRRDGTLAEHEDLVTLLGALQLQDGRATEAVATLGALEGRTPWILAQAQERSGAVPAARGSYRSIVRGSRDYDDEHGPELPAWLAGLRPRPERRAPTDLAVRRAALERLAALSGGIVPEQADLDAAEAFVEDFPWEAEGQATYARFLKARLRSPSMTPASRQILEARLSRAARLAEALQPRGAPRR